MTVWTACCTTKRVPSVWSCHPVITPCRSRDSCCATVSLCSRSTLCPVSCYVCRADYTHKNDIKIVNTLAAEQKLPKPCMVLNGIDMSKRKHGYYYGYGFYGRYGRYAYSHYGNNNDKSIKR